MLHKNGGNRGPRLHSRANYRFGGLSHPAFFFLPVVVRGVSTLMHPDGDAEFGIETPGCTLKAQKCIDAIGIKRVVEVIDMRRLAQGGRARDHARVMDDQSQKQANENI